MDSEFCLRNMRSFGRIRCVDPGPCYFDSTRGESWERGMAQIIRGRLFSTGLAEKEHVNSSTISQKIFYIFNYFYVLLRQIVWGA